MTELDFREKPSMEDALEHYGVKGMRWGVRKASIERDRRVARGEGSTADKIKSVSTLSGYDMIRGRGAEGGLERRANRLERRQNKAEARTAEKAARKNSSEKVTTEQIKNARLKNDARLAKIQQADIDFRLATTKKGKRAAIDTIAKYGREINNDPDTRIASKMTKGEKVLITMISGPFAVLPIAVNARATSKSNWEKKVPKWNAQQDANVKRVKATRV